MKKIGILAGAGGLVDMVIQGCMLKKMPFHIIAFNNQHVSFDQKKYSHAWFDLGQVGAIVQELKLKKCTHVVMAGSITRPKSWSDLKPDFKGTLLMAKFVGRSIGDDGLFKIIINYLENHNFKVIGCETLMSDNSFCEEGLITENSPDEQSFKDIVRGLEILKCLSAYDVGQSCLVQNGLVLGIEAIEGTDNLIERCHNLHDSQTGGVLIKTLKVGQDDRVDRATIGLKTIENLIKFGFKGLALQAGAVIMVEKQNVIKLANQHGLFIIGVNFAVHPSK